MRAVVEDELAPAVGVVLSETCIVHQWVCELVKAIVMAGSAIDDVPCGLGIVQLARIGFALVSRSIAVVYVRVAAEVEVYAIFVAVVRLARQSHARKAVTHKRGSKFVLQFVQMPPALL